MAYAIARFFGSAKTEPDASLKPLSVRMDDGKGHGLEVSAEDREIFSHLTRRFLDAVNALRYPRYAPQPPMSPADRSFYPFVRW